ncbi:hypothetical protein AYI69_g4818 [Smittium culicis]|uniref:Uncharacterized protein n=1 Tax=Smittium culicis TaxID=133412 RepID=A0A1R1YAG8_9FUNG|nr:hypothetical protein AYI69_g4818 [Smittium culicis]
MVCRQSGARIEYISIQIDKVQKPIHMPPVDADAKICDFVSRSDAPLCAITHPTTSKKCSSRPKNRKITAIRKQELVFDNLEDQRRFIEAHDLGNYDSDLIISNEKRSRRRSRYSSIHLRFLDRRISKNITGEMSALQILN